MSERRKTVDTVLTIIFFALAGVLVVFEFFKVQLSEDRTIQALASTSISRLIGGFIFLILVLKTGYRVFGSFKKKYMIGALLCFPALVIVVNNLPIIGLTTGNAYIERPLLIPLFALQCFAIGFFEELAFRGFVFPYIMENRRDTKKGIFISIVASGAIFGLVHMLNLLTGASPGGVFLQIGYSFLIGAMCSVVLLRTHNIWICVILHAIYDFCGFLVPTLGGGIIWDNATVIITALLSVVVFAYMTTLFFRSDFSDAKNFYRKN